jgi:hypothetical protein
VQFTLNVKESKWTFKTSATGGVGIGFAAASGGLIRLRDPSGNLVDFHYGSFGAGLSWGGKLPKIPKLPKINLKGKTATGSTVDFDSIGLIYMTGASGADELTIDDFRGPCITLEAGGGLVAGIGGTIFCLGVNPLLLAMGTQAVGLAISSTKAIVLVGGVNIGAQIGGGVSAGLGYFR